LIADEPTTALDVTVQSQILDLLADLQQARQMARLLITHDLGVVARMADQVGVMYAGQLVETAPRADFFAAPRHPYSQALFAALPEGRRGTRLLALPGQVPGFTAMPQGCRFFARCPKAQDRCEKEAPPLVDGVRCWFAEPAACRADARQPKGAAVAQVESPSLLPLLSVSHLAVHFPIKKGLLQRTAGYVRAVDGVDLCLHPGRTLALVGESGCGKTTVGKALMRLLPVTSGDFAWQGRPVMPADRTTRTDWRRRLQMVFQDPFSSLDPRMRVGEILAEGILTLGVATRDALQPLLIALLEQVGLPAEALARYPHEFSGGQRQRIAIARALAVSPAALICDEPTSALDVSVQAQILNLLSDMQARLGVAFLFITHNFAVVEYLAHEVAVMYLGKIVETGQADALLAAPAHPYTQALLSAVPTLEGGKTVIRLPGETPSPANPPAGCRFHPRCPKAKALCREQEPAWIDRPVGKVACHFPEV
jgi:peptide/nickel transport system ATP-binding protein